MAIPIIDIFAGPGGLGEGFSSALGARSSRAFKIALSIEKDPVAHRTLSLRAIFRLLKEDGRADHYYDYVQGKIDRETFVDIPIVRDAARHVAMEARCAELGTSETAHIDRWVRAAVSGVSKWILIGGPPCQAYSLAGRARRTKDEHFERDKKHFLYGAYLRMIRVHEPPVFVMENVTGMLTSTHGGVSIFSRIIKDLTNPAKGLNYEIRSFVTAGNGADLTPHNYVIESERFGVPQNRHRVILLGVRTDIAVRKHRVLTGQRAPCVSEVLEGLPELRSRISRSRDTFVAWQAAIANTPDLLEGWDHSARGRILREMRQAIREDSPESSGVPFKKCKLKVDSRSPLSSWLHDSYLDGVIQHEARSHMEADLNRYFFAASFARVTGQSPRLRDFPDSLLPDHENAAEKKFQDRFRVQLANGRSSTVVAHIAKDGHYYIHPDPVQCRSFTVREAARLQTFPDNYFFEGNRTQQYTQVGNAVPPFLARQLGEIVLSLLQDGEDVQEHNDAGLLATI